jgi:catechol 2,3-dioxygenase-like lactoylglutathione lyase family enzyme
MSGTGASADTSMEVPEAGTIDMKLEVVTLPVSDVDRAKSFYQRLGWRLDADFSAGEDVRGVQFTPPHSQCSIHFGKGLTAAEPGSADRSKRSRPGSPGGNGRTEMDVASLADLLHETAERHGSFEAVAPPHDWWDWYAAYMDARQSGRTPDEASDAAGRYMAEVKHVVVV